MDALLKIARCKIGNTILGPMPVAEFRKVRGFTLQTPVAPPDTNSWAPAFQVIDLEDYFGTKKRAAAPGHVVDPVILQMLDALAPKTDKMVVTAPPPDKTPDVICLPARTLTLGDPMEEPAHRSSRWIWLGVLAGLIVLAIGGFFLRRSHLAASKTTTTLHPATSGISRVEAISEQRLPRRTTPPTGLKRSRRS